MKVLIIAGGTGGHIFPGLAVAQILQQQQIEIHWLGSEIGLERELVSADYPLTCIAACKVRNKRLWNQLSTPWFLLRATWQAWRAIRIIKPHVILSMGGFVSAPGGIAAKLARKPLVLHEQNARAGYTNRLLAYIADAVLCAFPNTFTQKFKPMVVGNPVRVAISSLPAPTSSVAAASRSEGSDSAPLNLLILGGSQGAHAINELIIKMVTHFPQCEKLCIWHQTGKVDFEQVKQHYVRLNNLGGARVMPFIHEMAEAYAWADLVIARSGALTISELAAAGVPSILIPFPYAVDDHQWHNAQYLVEGGAAIVCRQADISSEYLSKQLLRFLDERHSLLAMARHARALARPEAVYKIAQVVQQLCHNR